jgi:hypothetical protein
MPRQRPSQCIGHGHTPFVSINRNATPLHGDSHVLELLGPLFENLVRNAEAFLPRHGHLLHEALGLGELFTELKHLRVGDHCRPLHPSGGEHVTEVLHLVPQVPNHLGVGVFVHHGICLDPLRRVGVSVRGMGGCNG